LRWKHVDVRAKYRIAFLKGIATLLPTILTIYILAFCYSFLDTNVGQPINSAIKSQLKSTEIGNRIAVSLLGIPSKFAKPVKIETMEEEMERKRKLSMAIDEKFPGWLGFLSAIVLVFLVGFFLASFVGSKIWWLAESTFLRLPVVRTIYPYTKQITDFVFESDEEKRRKFRSVVAIEYPRKGCYALGFLTGEGMSDIAAATGERMVTVFVPSSPTPITGWVVLVAEKEVVRLGITVDEAFRFAISGGVITPPSQLMKKVGNRLLPGESEPGEREHRECEPGESKVAESKPGESSSGEEPERGNPGEANCHGAP
jgi:uncharacterized membrane protein